MTIEKDNLIIHLDDNSQIAQKIQQGYSYTIENGKIIIGILGIDVDNKYQAMKAIDGINNLDELKVVLKKIVNKLL